MGYTKTRGIVLKLLPYNDKSRIVKIYTEHFGLRTFIVSAGTGKTARQKNALLQPLQPIILETGFAETSKLSRLGEIAAAGSIFHCSQHHAKRSILMFINEVLYKSLNEEMCDLPLFEFLIFSLNCLEEANSNFANFHLVFLIELSHFLGFKPVNNFSNTNTYFYLQDGYFGPFHNEKLTMEEEPSRLFSRLLETGYHNMAQVSLTAAWRNKLAELLLKYFACHLSSFRQIKSLEILAEVHAL